MFCCNGESVSVDEIVSIVGKADIYLDKPKLIFIQACRGDNPMFHVPSQPSSPVEHLSRGDKEGTSTMSDALASPDPFTDSKMDSNSVTVSVTAY